jgi:hypothetical protein
MVVSGVKAFVLATGLLVVSAPVLAQGQPPRPNTQPDPITVVIDRLEESLNARDRRALTGLFADAVPVTDVDRYASDLLNPNAVRTVVRERDRGPLEGAPPGDGFTMVVEIFVETPGRARIHTSSLDIRRPPGGVIESWRIVGTAGLSSVEGLYKLRLDASRAFTARNLEIVSEDFSLALPAGDVFLVQSDDGVTGAVLMGRGEMRFSPSPSSERGQLRLFAGTDRLATPFEYAYLRMSPGDYAELIAENSLTPVLPLARLARRAQEIFAKESGKSFSVDLQDLSRDAWHLLPPPDDFLAEVQTGRFDTLTYSRSSAQAEDVSLYRRQDRRTLSLYSSVAKLAARGRFYSDDVLRDYDVQDYSVEASIVPERKSIDARARLAIRVRASSLTTLMLRLEEGLEVTGVTSVELGRLLFLRLRNQNSILVNFPRVLPQDADLTLVVSYAGPLTPQELDSDTVQVRADQEGGSGGFEPIILLSNRSFWYPQNPVPDYATATIRIAVPDGYRVIASGEPRPTGEVTLRDLLTIPNSRAFSFRANQPLRYLAAIVSRFTKVAESSAVITGLSPANADRDRIAVSIEAHRSQQARGRQIVKPVEDILRFYAGLIGDAPYTSAAIALLENDLPGGHSPGYFAVINNPPLTATVTWRGDPAMFDGFPEFFLAHELAHQWWGQAVGWKNYHEQWISEGFAQYFAALYAQKARGDKTFEDMLRQFRRWALADSDQGPVHLGFRLGHIKSEPRVFRALVYNKGAGVLHMLRRLLGDEVFFNGLRRFYMDRRYQKAGTEDFERAMEAESGRTLDRFFERWIYGTEIPRVGFSSTIGTNAVTVRFEQKGPLVFDLPVTVTLVYADGRTTDVMVPVTDKQVERVIPTSAPVRQVQINRDSAALAEFDASR